MAHFLPYDVALLMKNFFCFSAKKKFMYAMGIVNYLSQFMGNHFTQFAAEQSNGLFTKSIPIKKQAYCKYEHNVWCGLKI